MISQCAKSVYGTDAHIVRYFRYTNIFSNAFIFAFRSHRHRVHERGSIPLLLCQASVYQACVSSSNPKICLSRTEQSFSMPYIVSFMTSSNPTFTSLYMMFILKVFHKSERKMQEKMNMTLHKDKNCVHEQQQYIDHL